MDEIREIMNLESLWTLWFWIMHVIAWSMTSHFVLGVPFDVIVQANREKDEAGPWTFHADAMIRASVFRVVSYFRKMGTVIVGVWSFLIGSLLTFAILFQNEFCMAALTFMLPLTAIYAVSIRWALWIDGTELGPTELRQAVRRLRFWVQLFGVIAVILAGAIAVYFWVQTHVPIG